MTKKHIWFLCLGVVLMAFIAASCSGATSSYSVGGASVDFGNEINDDLTIRSSKTTFNVNEEFHVSFNNNASFDNDYVTMKIEDSDSKEVIAEIDFDVDPEWTIMVTDGSLDEPGKYKFSFVVDGKVRASQEIIIKD